MTKTMLIPAAVLGAAALALGGCDHDERPPPPAYGYYNAPPPATYGGYYYGPSGAVGFYGHDQDDWHHSDGD